MSANITPTAKARRRGGPRTLAGKRKAAANALRHGLAVAVGADPGMGGAAARIAAALAAASGRFSRRVDLINPIAEAQAEMLQARAAKAALLNLATASLPAGPDRVSEAIIQKLPELIRIDRYERRAMFRRNRALRLLRRAAALGY